MIVVEPVPTHRTGVLTRGNSRHEDESLSEVFWFSKHTAMHPCSMLENVVLLHLASAEKAQELTAEYERA